MLEKRAFAISPLSADCPRLIGQMNLTLFLRLIEDNNNLENAWKMEFSIVLS